ncbi:MAG: hypothetical protein AABN33_18050 [Acidobacteriota bacterium]
MKNKLYLSLAVAAFLCVGVWSVYAQRPTTVRQAWEYKVIVVHRSSTGGGGWSAWFEDDKALPGPVSAVSKVKELGDQGWELVSVTPRSSETFSSGSYAGYTNQIESWFKRPK